MLFRFKSKNNIKDNPYFLQTQQIINLNSRKNLRAIILMTFLFIYNYWEEEQEDLIQK